MSTRPVLHMSFYESQNGEYVNPFQKMIQDAKKQKIEQEQIKIQSINKTIQNIEEVVDNFIPEDPQVDNSTKERRKIKSGPSKYNKEYFQQLDNNLKLINSYLQVLDKQT